MREKIQIGKQIQGARKRQKMSQEALAEAVGCSCKTISNIENGKLPELKQLVNICDVLKLSMDDLFDLGSLKTEGKKDVGDFVQRAPFDRVFSAEDFQNLTQIRQKIPLLTADQIKVIRLLLDLL